MDNDYEPTPEEIEGMDDSVHILVRHNTWLCLCGKKGARNRVGFFQPRPDPMSGCWTCLNVAAKEETR